MANNKIYTVVALLLSATIVLSCGKDDTTTSGTEYNKTNNLPSNNSAQYPSDNQNANISSGDPSVCGYEVPRLDTHYDYICHRLSNDDVNYTLEYNKEMMHPRWVAYTYNQKNAQKNAPTRTDAWAPDPYYDNQKQYQLATGTFPGYTRGHLVGSAERYYSTEANEQTFYMTNLSPQLYNFNGDYWGEIEDKARDIWGRGVIDQKSTFYGGTLYIVKGGTVNKEENILGYINVKNTQGQSVRMAVPRYYFMACLFISSSGEAKAIGFWMEHKDYKLNTKDAAAMQNLRRSAACSVNDLEQRTGIDFFCNLTDAVEDAVEAKYDIAAWPGL
ncbi:MAG: DNA/RNA non-specific endonuclease [Bacteroidaceae bacterium]|nr:DNA/RNA non-specific endonuclease [Bacteroidaceae bacterium]